MSSLTFLMCSETKVEWTASAISVHHVQGGGGSVFVKVSLGRSVLIGDENISRAVKD